MRKNRGGIHRRHVSTSAFVDQIKTSKASIRRRQYPGLPHQQPRTSSAETRTATHTPPPKSTALSCPCHVMSPPTRETLGVALTFLVKGDGTAAAPPAVGDALPAPGKPLALVLVMALALPAPAVEESSSAAVAAITRAAKGRTNPFIP